MNRVAIKSATVRSLVKLMVICVVALVAAAAAPAQETRLMRFPDVSKDHIVFTYAGDLWTVARAGGMAHRLTAHPGDEVFPKFSPDGKWIAFSGEYDGNVDVYVMPSAGGEPRRLTSHPGPDLVLGWTPDGKKILFRSSRVSQPPDYTRLFTVSPEGGMPDMLPIPRASLTSYSPDGNKIAYLPTSQDFRTWKRYRGGWKPPISIYDLKNNTYSELPKTAGMDLFPMWHDNSIYYINDTDGVMNLYRYDISSKRSRKLTTFTEYDVKWPSLGQDAITFENGGMIYVFDLASEKATQVKVTVAGDDVESRAEVRGVSDQIRSAGISPTGARAYFEARGDIFTLPAEHGSPRNLTMTPGEHEQSPAWSPDGKWVAYLSDKSGEFEIYTRPQLGGDEVRITTDGAVYRYGLTWSPDSKKIMFYDKSLKLWYVDLESKQPVLVDTDERGVINDGAWSPDSRWIAYGKTGKNSSSSIYLYNLADKKATRITQGFYNDGNPAFDPDGKYLYFISQRFYYPTSGVLEQRYGYFSTSGIFALTLKADEPSPFAPQSDEEKAAEAAKPPAAPPNGAPATPPAGAPTGTPPAGNATPLHGSLEGSTIMGGTMNSQTPPAAAKPPEPKPIQIDLDGLGNRIVQVPIPAGLYGRLSARKGKIFYTSVPMEALEAAPPSPTRPRPSLHVFDLKTREDKVLLDGFTGGYELSVDGAKLLYNAGPFYGITDAIPGKARVGDGRLNTAPMQSVVDPKAEWAEMLHEAWRIERDFYYDPNMGGVDWAKLEKRYAALLPYVRHRSDLNYIIGEMIAELSTSHTYVLGGEAVPVTRLGVGLLGADYDVDQGFYRFKKIFQGENWNPATRSPLTEPGLKIKEGNYLISVNGVPVRSTTEIYSYFQGLSTQTVALKVNDKPSADGAWEIAVRPIGSEAQLRYLDWVEARRKIVDAATGGRIGYMHVPDTSIAGIIQFDKYLNAQLGKEGLIVDERYNHGGSIPDFYTEKLSRHLMAVITGRDGLDQPWPPQAIYGPKVMIVNELAGSGGDCFPWFFHLEKIGPIVGTRTWGGLVGYNRTIPMMDGGSVTAPEAGFWSTANGGEWIVENRGVDPDYTVEERPDLVVNGHDPQLEKAIELAMDALKKMPPMPKRPAFPVQPHR
jgi:tricorn protease